MRTNNLSQLRRNGELVSYGDHWFGLGDIHRSDTHSSLDDYGGTCYDSGQSRGYWGNLLNDSGQRLTGAVHSKLDGQRDSQSAER